MSIIGSNPENLPYAQTRARVGARHRSVGSSVTIVLWLWLCLLLFGPSDVYSSLSMKVGVGSVSGQDIILTLLALASFWLVEMKDATHKGPVRTYFRFIAALSLYCTLLGSLSQPAQSILTEWKRIIGLFAGVSLGTLLRKDQYRTESVILSFVSLTICSSLIASVLGIGQQPVQVDMNMPVERVGGLGLVLTNTIWPIWLPLLLCRLITRSQMKYKILLACLLIALVFITVTFGARSTALSVLGSILTSIAWVLLTRWRLHTQTPIPARRSHRTIAANGLGVVLILLATILIVAVSIASGRVIPFFDAFAHRLVGGESIDIQNVDARITELREMVSSMDVSDLILGKGYGSVYYFSVAEAWVAWGLYSSPYILAPHILIGGLLLKGGIFLFLIGGILLPFWAIRNLIVSLIRPQPNYLLCVAPYDLAILTSAVLLYTSFLYDGITLLALSLLLTLRLYMGNLWRPERSVNTRAPSIALSHNAAMAHQRNLVNK